MLPQVPELVAAGFRYVADVSPDLPSEVLVVSTFQVVNLELRCHADALLIGGRAEVRAREVLIYLGLTEPGATLSYEALSFGFTLSHEGQAVAIGEWPIPQQRYISSDQSYLLAVQVTDLAPDRAYVLRIWSRDHGELFEATYRLLTPRPVRPFPSWSWDGSAWQPPVPYPDEGSWFWDEAGQQWVPAE